MLFGKTSSRRVDDPNIVEFYIEPGVIVARFEANKLKAGKISGSISHKDLAAYNRLNDSLSKKWLPIFHALEVAKQQNDSNKLERINNIELPKYRAEKQVLITQFIKDHPHSYHSAELLIYQSQTLPMDSLKKLYEGLDSKVKISRNGQEINSFITVAENLLIGKKAPDFTMPNLNGEQISLKDFRGKYVLLDFWASWCIPCRKEHPNMKEAFDRFKERGFTIVSVSLDRLADKADWIKAIEQDQLGWTQLCDFKAWQSETVKLFNLMGKGIPANFLLGPNSEIIAKDLRGDDLKLQLTLLFQ
jgi:peroxiredoxin